MSLILPQRGRIRPAAAGGAFHPSDLLTGTGRKGWLVDPTDTTSLLLSEYTASTMGPLTSATTDGDTVKTIIDTGRLGGSSFYDYAHAIETGVYSNNNFATDTLWTKESGWTIPGDNTAVVNTAGTGAIYQSTLTTNAFYIVKFTITNYTSGGIVVFTGGTNFTATLASANGDYVFFIRANATFQSGGVRANTGGANLKLTNLQFHRLWDGTTNIPVLAGNTATGGHWPVYKTDGTNDWLITAGTDAGYITPTTGTLATGTYGSFYGLDSVSDTSALLIGTSSNYCGVYQSGSGSTTYSGTLGTPSDYVGGTVTSPATRDGLHDALLAAGSTTYEIRGLDPASVTQYFSYGSSSLYFSGKLYSWLILEGVTTDERTDIISYINGIIP